MDRLIVGTLRLSFIILKFVLCLNECHTKRCLLQIQRGDQVIKMLLWGNLFWKSVQNENCEPYSSTFMFPKNIKSYVNFTEHQVVATEHGPPSPPGDVPSREWPGGVLDGTLEEMSRDHPMFQAKFMSMVPWSVWIFCHSAIIFFSSPGKSLSMDLSTQEFYTVQIPEPGVLQMAWGSKCKRKWGLGKRKKIKELLINVVLDMLCGEFYFVIYFW